MRLRFWEVELNGTSPSETEVYFGPVTAMDYLYNSTKEWTNVSEIKINYADEGNNYGTIKTINELTQITKKDETVVTVLNNQDGYSNLRARMPYVSEVSSAGCLKNENLSCPVWLTNYLSNQEDPLDEISGYWTFSSREDDNMSAWCVSYDGSLGERNVEVIYDNNVGVRPVITVPQQNIYN